MKIYLPRTTDNRSDDPDNFVPTVPLPHEDVWLKEDFVCHYREACVEQELLRRKGYLRNERPYLCLPGTDREYPRMLAERKYHLHYREVHTLDELFELLKDHKYECVYYSSGALFLGVQPQ